MNRHYFIQFENIDSSLQIVGKV